MSKIKVSAGLIPSEGREGDSTAGLSLGLPSGALRRQASCSRVLSLYVSPYPNFPYKDTNQTALGPALMTSS